MLVPDRKIVDKINLKGVSEKEKIIDFNKCQKCGLCSQTLMLSAIVLVAVCPTKRLPTLSLRTQLNASVASSACTTILYLVHENLIN